MHTKLASSQDAALYLQIKETIRDKIESGELKSGDRLPTEMELAGFYNVSRITARQAILGLVDEGYVFRQPRRGTFVCDLGRREKKQTNIIGVIVATIGYSFVTNLIEIIEERARQAGHTIMPCAAGNVLERVIDSLHSLAENNVKKIIYAPVQSGNYEQDNLVVIREMMKLKMQYVLLDSYLIGANCNYVGSDNFQGAYEATKYLISLGHERIAMLSNLISSSVTDRLAGFSKAMREAGLYVPQEAIAEVSGPKSEEVAYECTKNLLSGFKPTAILSINDTAAIGAYYAIRDSGLDIPGDVSLISFDEVNVNEAPLRFTVVKQSAKMIGKAAVELLLEDTEESDPKRIIVPTELIIRDSCAKNKLSC